MKDTIIQKIKNEMANLINQAANEFLTANLPDSPTLNDYQNLLSKVQSGEIEVK